jgi:hypothetical protein
VDFCLWREGFMDKQVEVIVAGGVVQEVFNPSNLDGVIMDFDHPSLDTYPPSNRECPEKWFQDYEEVAPYIRAEQKKEKSGSRIGISEIQRLSCEGKGICEKCYLWKAWFERFADQNVFRRMNGVDPMDKMVDIRKSTFDD